ncbi:MAG: tyrosine-type recombinase/integrase [Eubacteriales bacterium]|nr:tyrosine-type recombinase/integrase [Eubacteriales bacterium]
MKVVQPIRNTEVLERCYDIAREHDRKSRKGALGWELLLVVGLNTSLRVSDFTRFKVGDLRGKEYAQIEARKTGKEARILINPAARREMNRMLAGRPEEEYAFQSREIGRGTKLPKPITRQRAYQIINSIAREAGIEERIGCHTLRKTFGYHYYKMTGDIVSLQRILGHSNRRDTLVYIGVIQDEIDKSLRKFQLVGKR